MLIVPRRQSVIPSELPTRCSGSGLSAHLCNMIDFKRSLALRVKVAITLDSVEFTDNDLPTEVSISRPKERESNRAHLLT